MATALAPQVQPFFDPATWTVSYVVYDRVGGHAAIVDSVLDYDTKSGRTQTGSADQILAFLAGKQLRVQWILETHAHADHLSAAHYLRKQVGGQIAVGAAITDAAPGQAVALRRGGLHFAPTALRCAEPGPVAELTALAPACTRMPLLTPPSAPGSRG